MYMPKSATLIPQEGQASGYMPKSAVRVNNDSLLTSIGKGIVNPFLRTGKNIGGAGYELFRGAKSALGDQGAYVNPETGEVVQNPFLNEAELTKVSQPLSLQNGSALRQQIGDSANIVSYAVPFGKGANIATKALAPGATVGFLSSIDENATPESVLAGTAGGTVLAGATHLTGNALQKLPGYLNKKSESVIVKGLGNPMKQAEIAKKGKMGFSTFLKKNNILDRSAETAQEVLDNKVSLYDDLMLRSGKSTKTGNIINEIDKKILSLQTGPGRFSDSNRAMVEELLRRRAQFLESVGADATKSPMRASIKDVGLFRRESIDPDIPESMFGLDPQGSGKAKGAKEIRNIFRKTINSSDPRLERLGLDIGMAKGAKEVLEKAASRTGNKQVINFSKLGSAGLGGMLGGVPGAIAGFAAEQVANHPSFIRATSNTLSGASKAQSFANKILFNPNVQRVIKQPVYQGASRIGGATNLLFQKPTRRSQTQGSLRKSELPEAYVPSNVQNKQLVDSTPTLIDSQKALRYKPAKNVFSNKSSFGNTPKLKRGSFY